MLGIIFHLSPNAQFLVHNRIPEETKTDIVWRQTRDVVKISIIFLAGGQVMLKHGICTDNGQHSELMRLITDTG